MNDSSQRPASVLDGFFSDDVERIAEANRALKANDGSDADKSWGRVEQATAFYAGGRYTERDGIVSEPIFGPRKVLACACGARVGEEHRNETCAKCGVLCGDPSLRSWRFGHIETSPLIHPLLIAEIARATGHPIRDVQRVLNGEASLDGNTLVDDDVNNTGPRAIAALLSGVLADAAIITRVPLPPPGDRPLIENLTPTQAMPWIGPVNEAWLAFLHRVNRYARLAELNAPAIIIANEARMTQAAFVDVVAYTMRAPSIHERVGWRKPDMPENAADDDMLQLGAVPPILARPRPSTTDEEELSGNEVRVVFVDEKSFVMQRGLAVFHMNVDGKIVSRFPSPLRTLRSVHGSRVFFEGWQRHPYFWPLPENVEVTDAAGPMSDVAIYDLAKSAWLTKWPDDIVAITAEHGEPEDLGLVDRRTGASMRCPWNGNDRPHVLAWTSDARFAWMGSEDDGGVIEVATGIPQLEPQVELTDPQRPAHSASEVEGDDDDDDIRESGCALGLTENFEWRMIHTEGTLSDGRTSLAHLGVADAYAFAPACANIVRVNGAVVDVLDHRGELVRTFRVDPSQ